MPDFNPKQEFKTTLMIFTALLGGVFVFAMIALFVTYGQKEPQTEVDSLFAITLILGIISVLAGPALSKGIISKALNKSFKEKMAAYRTALIIRLSFLEGAALFSITTYLITADMLLLVVAAVMVFLFRFNRPTPVRIAKTMHLKREEAEQLA